MEIEEKHLDSAKCGSWVILMKIFCIDSNAVNCQLKVQEYDSATLSIAQKTCASVDQKL